MTKKSNKVSNKRKLQVGDQVFKSLSIKPTATVNKSEVMANNKRVDLSQNKLKDPYRNSFDNIKGHDLFPLALYAIDNYLINQDAMKERQEFQRDFRNQFINTPITDYNHMHGPDSSGGTEYQSIIRRGKNGANIRRGTSPDITEVEVEGGEFIQLPNLSTEHVHGPSHEQGGVHTNLPDGSRVFSNFLRPFGSKKTYAQQAKKHDPKKELEVLNNPYADDIDRNTAKLMFDRKNAILNELFEDQQRQNGNSDGTDQARMMAKFGLDLKKGESLSFTDPFEYGGVYTGGMAEFQDGGMFPEDSTFYGATPGDTSVLTTGTDVMGSAKFQGGGYYSPEGKKYKLPEDAVIKKEDDKSIKAGDFVQRADGTIVKVSSVQAKMLAKASRSSAAKDFAEGRLFLRGWAQESPENANKLKIAEDIIAQAIKAGQIEEIKPRGWKEGDPTELIIKGNFKPSFKDRLLISEVVNKTGKGFGTDKYRIKIQQPTEGYSTKSKSGTLEKTGSFVGGMTPQDYEQRATYERALAEGVSPEEAEKLAITSDPKQKAENRRNYLQELNYDVSDIPDSALISDDFYKNRYQDVTKAIENSFSESGFRPSIGNDMLSGWEHYDAASYVRNPSYANIPVEEQPPGPLVLPPGSQIDYQSTYKPYPSTMGRFPLYQAAPEALGYMYANRPYSYYTPDFTHTELAPPTLNIDPQLQAIDDSFQSAIRQNTGNASIGNSRNAAMFNQALAAKQQAFGNKQNYDANARFQADQYNAQARDLENYRDVTSAASIYNEYMAAAQDAAEQEKLRAISSLTNKYGKFNQDEFVKMFNVANLMPNYYYEGTDLRNPLKVNPYSQRFYNRYPRPQAPQGAVAKPVSTNPIDNKVAQANNISPLDAYQGNWAQPVYRQDLTYPITEDMYYPSYTDNVDPYNNVLPVVLPTALPMAEDLYPGLPQEDYLPETFRPVKATKKFGGKVYKK
jgi:hypothetical protein